MQLRLPSSCLLCVLVKVELFSFRCGKTAESLIQAARGSAALVVSECRRLGATRRCQRAGRAACFCQAENEGDGGLIDWMLSQRLIRVFCRLLLVTSTLRVSFRGSAAFELLSTLWELVQRLASQSTSHASPNTVRPCSQSTTGTRIMC